MKTHKKECTRKNRGLCACDPSFNSPAWKPSNEVKHTPTFKMPVIQLGNRLSEIRDRVKGNYKSAEYTLELIDDALKAHADIVNSHEALLEALQRGLDYIYKYGDKLTLKMVKEAIEQAEGK